MGVPYAEVIGDPIAHSRSPAIHKFWLETLGLDYDYRSRRIAAADLPAYLEACRRDPLWCGASITIPHKQAVLGLLDALAWPAGSIGAVNAVTREGAADPRLIGHNTDAFGLLDTLRDWLAPEWRHRFASIIGTGGAAAAVAWALAQEHFLLIVYSRSDARGAAFRQRFAPPDVDFVQPLEALAREGAADWGDRSGVREILVNATPLGMRGFAPLPVNLAGMAPGTLIYDLVYDPVETALLRDARERGFPVISGLDMLIAQAARAFTLFFGEEAPREHDDALKALLGR
jgi:shikimate dehydrogenase